MKKAILICFIIMISSCVSVDPPKLTGHDWTEWPHPQQIQWQQYKKLGIPYDWEGKAGE